MPELFHIPLTIAPSENLTERVARLATDGPSPFRDDPVYTRVFEHIVRGLHRRAPRHVLLVGERGVGQSSVLVELARRAAAGRPPFLRDKQILTVDCRHVAPDESLARMDALLAGVAARDDVVLAIDGMTALLRGERVADQRPRLLSALTRVRCRVIGLVTPHQFEDWFANEPDMQEFFSAVELPEPDVSVAIELMHHFAAGLVQQFEVDIDPRAVERAVLLTDSYVLNERLPYKALRILHAECDDIRFEQTQLGSSRRSVTEQDIVRRVAMETGIPESTLDGIAERSDYARSLGEVIVGQDHAVREVATELALIKAGMTDRGKPASVMLFVGPTGTGKTETAKALARLYSSSKRVKTFTLGNFVEPHSVSGIIGVPPGYVGHDDGGRLVNELLSDPHSVVLLDEADKAHPDVMQPFLNLFDEGWVYDQRGTRAYADRAMFILTTNVGQRQILEWGREGMDIDEITRKTKESLSQIRHTKSNRPVFTPELLARIKRVVVFGGLDRPAMLGIAHRLVDELARHWTQHRDKRLVVSEALVEQIADRAHERDQQAKGKEGGRIVRKLIADRIEAPIQRLLAEVPQRYRDCTTVLVEPDPERDGEATVTLR